MDLKNAVAVVTGGNGGLGQRICHALAKCGTQYRGRLCAQRRRSRERSARHREARRYGRGICLRCDHPEQVQRMVGDVVQALWPPRHPDQRCRLQQDHPVSRSRCADDRGMVEDHGRQSHRAAALHQGGGAGHAEPRARPHRQYRVGRRPCTVRLVDRLRGLQGRAHSSERAACRSRLRPTFWSIGVAPGLLEGTRATANLAQTQIEHAAAASLLKKAADKDDVADQVVTMCAPRR